MARAYYNEVPVDVMEIVSLPGIEELRPYEYSSEALETRLTLKTAASSRTFQKLVKIHTVRFPRKFDLEVVHEREAVVEFIVDLRAYCYFATYNYHNIADKWSRNSWQVSTNLITMNTPAASKPRIQRYGVLSF